MKIFPKNFFTPEELGRWAFGGLLLATLGSWSVAAWMTLGGWLVDFSKGVKISPVFTGIFILFVLIAAFFNLAFFYSCVPEKFKKWFFPFCAVLVLSVVVCGYFFGKEIGYYTFIAAFFWVLPLVIFHKNSHWGIPGSACWTLFFMGCGAFYDLMQNCFRVIHMQMALLSNIEVLAAVTGGAALGGALFCLSKLYSLHEKWWKILSVPTVCVLTLFFISWGTMTGMALYEERTYQKNLICTDGFSDFSLDADGLRRDYYKNMPFDWDFWRTFEKALRQFKEQAALQKQNVFIEFPRGDLDKKSAAAWKNMLESSVQIGELEKLLSGTIPPKFRLYKKYYLCCLVLDEIFLLHDFCRLQTWRIRFALENNDPAMALEALKRIDNSVEYLMNDHISIVHKYSQRLLDEKKNALELLLESGLLPEQELKKQIDISIRGRKKLAAAERTALAAEIAFEFDFLDSFWQGAVQLTEDPAGAIKKLRWFAPQCWYIFRYSSNIMIGKMKKNAFKEIEPFSAAQFLFAGKLSSLKKKERWYSELKARFLLLETMLKLEQEKRRSGDFPVSAPDWLPVDPLYGKKFHYKKGEIATIEPVYDPRTGIFQKTRRTIPAVSVESSEEDINPTCSPKNRKNNLRSVIRL